MKPPESKLVYQGTHLDLFGGPGRWEYVRRRKVSAGVTVVALTPQNRLLLVEQHRIPLGKRVIELPAGLVAGGAGSHREAVLAAARRELVEETGYRCHRMTLLCQGSALPGLTDELNAMCLAQGLRLVDPSLQQTAAVSRAITHAGRRGLREEDENITVHEVPLAGAVGWLARQRRKGKIIDLKVYAGLFFACEADTGGVRPSEWRLACGRNRRC